jgi:hypothetical protein
LRAFDELLPDEAAALRAEIERRIRGGESRSAIRAELIEAGLPSPIADQLLAAVPVPLTRLVGPAAGTALVFLAMVVLPVAGAVAGAWAAWSPVDAECGMWVFPAMAVAAGAGVLGSAVGLALAVVLVWFLSAWFQSMT